MQGDTCLAKPAGGFILLTRRIPIQTSGVRGGLCTWVVGGWKDLGGLQTGQSCMQGLDLHPWRPVGSPFPTVVSSSGLSAGPLPAGSVELDHSVWPSVASGKKGGPCPPLSPPASLGQLPPQPRCLQAALGSRVLFHLCLDLICEVHVVQCCSDGDRWPVREGRPRAARPCWPSSLCWLIPIRSHSRSEGSGVADRTSLRPALGSDGPD